ncbi:DUF4845 domain-containing protein [Roseateles chitosanitabidus]|jgi:hypothetical protein|uniref:DUF4845 domain-containing protein n=1 Tax=Roseateles chitosanitabidus TaxID=65048 RepID=UPI0008321153|nr:DUF4845 domain-containing protein [Roseateles chitosanitabidus]MBO9688633.1 DUF4845 domain-containing protein [Roseateles chitosanitabidus]
MTARNKQRGISLLGLLFWAILIGGGSVVGMRVIPTVMEYYTIQKAVDKIARDNPPTVPAARDAFARAKEIEYSIVSIEPKDLVITKSEDKVKISFGYDKEVPLFGPVFLIIKYKGASH